MRIGKIIEMPTNDSSYGVVHDEFGNQWTVDRGELPPKGEADDSYAYHVDFYHNTSVPLLRRDEDLE